MRRKTNSSIAALALWLAAATRPGSLAAQGDAHLNAVLAALDKASLNFTSAEADVEKDQYEKIVKDTTVQKGRIYILRDKGGAVEMSTRLDNPGAQVIEYKASKIRRYQFGLKCVETYTAAPASVDSFLTLGFGGSGADLKKNWTIADQGSETIAGVSVEKLDLVAKDPKARANFTHVTLWIDPTRGVSLKQEFFTPSGDTQTALYTNIKVNQRVDKKPYEFSGSPCGK